MKKAIVYTVLPAMLLTFAAGCGMADKNERVPSPSPVITASPEMATPDVGDGIVNDRDGVITPEDNGIPASPDTGTTARPGLVSPAVSPTATPNG